MMKLILKISICALILLTVSFSAWASSKNLIRTVARDALPILKSLANCDSGLPTTINHTVQEHSFFPTLTAAVMGRNGVLTSNGSKPFDQLAISSGNIGTQFSDFDLGFGFEFVIQNGNGELTIKDLSKYIRDGVKEIILKGEDLKDALNVLPAAYLVYLNSLLKVPGWVTTQLELPQDRLLEAYVVAVKLINISLEPVEVGEVRGIIAYVQGEVGERIIEDGLILDTDLKYSDSVQTMIDSLISPFYRLYNLMEENERSEYSDLFKQGVLAIVGILENSNLILPNEAAIIEDKPLEWLAKSAKNHDVGSMLSGSIIKHMKHVRKM